VPAALLIYPPQPNHRQSSKLARSVKVWFRRLAAVNDLDARLPAHRSAVG
jgi:hypothetical protein